MKTIDASNFTLPLPVRKHGRVKISPHRQPDRQTTEHILLQKRKVPKKNPKKTDIS